MFGLEAGRNFMLKFFDKTRQNSSVVCMRQGAVFQFVK